MQPPPNIEKCLHDILACIDRIDRYIGPERYFSVYQRDEMLRQAIERNLEIIGEATGRILKIDPKFPIEHARQIVNMRNLVIHAYDAIDDENVWLIVCKYLPLLKQEAQCLLGHE